MWLWLSLLPLSGGSTSRINTTLKEYKAMQYSHINQNVETFDYNNFLEHIHTSEVEKGLNTIKHKLNPSCLRAYDIRGGIGEILELEDAYFIGRSFAKIIKDNVQQKGKNSYKITPNSDKPIVAIGYDGRITSELMQKLTTQGLADGGVEVINIGLCPSPMLYFTVRNYQLDGGIMVTASHNPGHHNGFKMMYAKDPLFGSHIQNLGEIAEHATFDKRHGESFIRYIDVANDYLAKIKTAIKTDDNKKKTFLDNFKICWDIGNGSAGNITQELVKQIGGKHILLNEKIDGTFPAHHPDPTVAENLQQLIEKVKDEHCDLGIAFDGDGDRIGAVDGNGNIFWGDQLMSLFAEDVLKKLPNSKIIVDVKASQTFFDRVATLGGEGIMWKTGHSYIKNKLAETKAPLAGEMSGHIFFADEYFGFDDAIYAALRLINYFTQKQALPKDIHATLPKSYASKEYRISVKEADKLRIVEEIAAKVKAAGKPMLDIDGMRVSEPSISGGWWLLRSSNTQSAITIRAESNNQEGLDSILNILAALLSPYGIDKSIFWK